MYCHKIDTFFKKIVNMYFDFRFSRKNLINDTNLFLKKFMSLGFLILYDITTCK